MELHGLRRVVTALLLLLPAMALAQGDPSAPPLPSEPAAPSPDTPAPADPPAPPLPAPSAGSSHDGASAPAAATSSATPVNRGEAPRIEPRDYGWQFLVIDPLAITAIGIGYFGSRSDLLVLGGLTYLVNGPLIHLLNGEWGGAGWSLAARVLGVPAAFVIAAVLLQNTSVCGTSRGCDGLLGGVLIAGTVLGWAWDGLSAQSPRDPENRLWSVSPAVHRVRTGELTYGLSVRY